MDAENGDLRDMWCATARRATDLQLVVSVAVALLIAIAFTIFVLIDVRRALPWWPLVLPILFAGAFGLWGIADRELESRRTSHGSGRVSHDALIALRAGAAVAAGIIGVLGILGMLRLTIGTWIS